MEDLRSTQKGGLLESPVVIGAVILLTLLIRALHPGQPIVENYVGRQVPTAMVARNLDRGSGFFWPQLDTAPFPNYFVVEPPVYQAFVVTLCRLTGLGYSPAGRLVSAMLSALAAWGLYELARRREGSRVALLAVFVFSVFPLTIRYGRAFQPDASMLGATVAGLACWDRSLTHRGHGWLVAGWCLLALGFAIKITSAFLLIPLFLLIARSGRLREMIVACTTLMPGLLWYLWADHLIGQGGGSRASADNRSVWLGVLGPSALFQAATIKVVGWSLLVRAFTPLGALLAVIGLAMPAGDRTGDRWFWCVWGGSALAAMVLLAGKLHHEYYWLPLAPVAAVGVARALELVLRNRRVLAGAVAAVLVVLSAVQARSTWLTPFEWQALVPAGRAIRAIVPPEAWVAASEALLYQADRRGCRMEWTDDAAARAAGEWGGSPAVESPLDLIEFYRRRGARYFADLGGRDPESQRKGLHDAIRRRYKVIVDSPEVLIADLSDSGMSLNAN
jgi:4-amino-4-deoxy-L-arabinose transferase-like glycosyltransferase